MRFARHISLECTLLVSLLLRELVLSTSTRAYPAGSVGLVDRVSLTIDWLV